MTPKGTRFTPTTELLLVLVLVGGLLLAAKWFLYSHFLITSDVFSYSRALANTFNGRFLWDPTSGFLFGQHSYVLLLAFLPFYFVTTSAFTLIASGAIAHVAAGYFVARLTAGLFPGVRVLPTLAALAYLLNAFVLQYAVMMAYGFQPDVLAPPFFFAAFAYYVEGRKKGVIVGLTCLALVKEEFALLAFGVVCLLAWDLLLATKCPRLRALGQHDQSPRCTSRDIAKLILLSAALVAVSFATLKIGKAVTDFSYAPDLGPEELKKVFLPGSLAVGLNYAFELSWSVAFLNFFCPELLPVIALRGTVNMVTYGSPQAHAVSWSQVTLCLLLVLSVIGSIRRLANLGIDLRVLSSWSALAVCCSILMFVSPEMMGVKSGGLELRDSLLNKSVAQHRRQLARSVRKVRKLVRLQASRGLILVSPPLLKSFQERDAMVARFVTERRPSLLEDANAAVLLGQDGDLAELLLNSGFVGAFQDAQVTLLIRARKRPASQSSS